MNSIDFKKFKEKGKMIYVLDMSASPGSKTTQLADLFEYHNIKFHITALEIEKKRLIKLMNNIQRQNFKNIEIYSIDARKFNSKNKYDIVILDAPCSGNLIDDENWLKKRNLNGIEKMSKLQKELLRSAKNFIKKDGILIYSTCSLEPEENEMNINWAVNKLNLKTEKIKMKMKFDSLPLKKYKGQHFTDKNSIRIIPFHSKTQGFFVSKLKLK